jgi:hypothetical protein
MCGMNNNVLQYPKHRAAIERSAPIGKAVAVAFKNRGFHFALSPKIRRFIGFDGKNDYLKLNGFNQKSACTAKFGEPDNQMPIDRRPS